MKYGGGVSRGHLTLVASFPTLGCKTRVPSMASRHPTLHSQLLPSPPWNRASPLCLLGSQMKIGVWTSRKILGSWGRRATLG